MWTRWLADQAPAEADRDRVRTRARLQLREQMTHVRLDRFLRQEQPLPDFPVHEPVGDELQNLDLTAGRLLLELAQRALQRNHVRTAGTAPPRRNFLEAARVRQVTAEDLLALSSVHARSIGGPTKPL